VGGGAVAELSRWCGRCGTGLRSGARFCVKCGQRVIDDSAAETPEPGPGIGQTPAESPAHAPAGPSGPGFTEVGLPSAMPFPGPDSPPRNEWSDWYSATEPSSLVEPPANPQGANQQLASPPAAGPPAAYPPQAYQPTVYQPPVYPANAQQPQAYQSPGQQPPMPYPGPGYQPPYRPPFEPAPAGGPPGAPLRPGSGNRRSRAPLFWSVLATVAAVAVVMIVVLLHPFNRHETINDAANSTKTTRSTASVAASSPAAAGSASSSPSASASPSVSASVSSTAVTEKQAASTVAGLLANSVTDRTAINNAYNDVYRCGPNLDGDAAVFTRAVSSRRTLLASLASMPGRATLPPALLSNLANAWQASMSADQGLATWADDEVTHGCVAGDTKDPGYQTTITPDNEATQYKTDFAAGWNPIAVQYGLTTYQQGQL
jgi:hypothetical protein